MITLKDIGFYDFSKIRDENFGTLSSPFYKDLDRILPINNDSAFEKFTPEAPSFDANQLFSERVEVELSEHSNLGAVDFMETFERIFPHFLRKEMISNLELMRVKALNILQKHVFVMCSLDRPFILYSEMKSGRKTGYLLPLIEKVSQAKEGRPTKWEGPSMLIVTFSEQRAKHIANVFEKLSKNLCVKSVCMSFGSENDLELIGGDVYIGKIDQITKFLMVNHVDASVIDYLVIEECNKALIPDYSRELMRIHSYFSLHCGVPTLTYMIYDKVTKVQPVLQGFLNKNHSVVKFMRPTRVSAIKVHVITFYERNTWLVFRKMRLLERQLRSSEDMEYECKDNRWLILVPNYHLAHYLCGYLCNTLKYSPLALTSLTDRIGLEDVTGKFREKHNVLIAEYDVINKIPESGYIANIVCFEIPKDQSLQTLRKIRYLARNVKGNMFLFFNPLFDMNFSGVICKFLTQCNEPISQELYDLYQWMRKFKDVDRDRTSFPISWTRLVMTESPKFSE